MSERKIAIPFPEIPLYPANKTEYLKGGLLVQENLPVETRPAGLIPTLAEESVFYNQQFIPLTDTVETLEDYLATGEIHKKRQIVRSLAHKTLTNAGGFGQVTSVLANLAGNERLSPHLRGFKESFLNSLEQEARTVGKTPSVEIVGEYLELIASENQHKSLAQIVLAEFFREAKTQKKMVNLTYNLCVYALRGRNPEVEKLVAKILSYSRETTDILDPNSKNVQKFAGGLFAEDDETLGKFHDVDETTRLLIDTYFPTNEGQYLQTIEQIMSKGTTIPFGEEQKGEIGSRNRRISFFLRTVRSPQYIPSEQEISTQDLIFPESVIYDTSRELRQLLADRQSEQHPDDRKGKFYAPTGVYRYIHLHPLEEKPLSGLMRYALVRRYKAGEPLTVTSNEARDCALNFMRPLNLFPSAQNELRESRGKTKDRLRQHFKYMLRPSGEKVLVMDKALNDSLGIKAVTFFPSEHFTLTDVQIQFGKYIIPLLVDEHYELLGTDGKSLNIDEESQLWWETFVLNYLSDLVCEDDEAKSFVTGESEEQDVEKTTHVETKDRKDIQPHRVKLPLGYHYTEKQRSRVLTITGGFLDLKTYNETMSKFTPEQSYTWAFPSEKYTREFLRKKRKPKIYRMKKTESKLRKIIEAAD